MTITKKNWMTLIFISILWVILPLTNKATTYIKGWEIGIGYTPVVNLRNLKSLPKVKGITYTDIVWRHERYSFLWLPIGGSKQGQYGFYKFILSKKGRGLNLDHRKSFVPISNKVARKWAEKLNTSIPEQYPISNWELYFGWLVLAPLIIFLLFKDGYFNFR